MLYRGVVTLLYLRDVIRIHEPMDIRAAGIARTKTNTDFIGGALQATMPDLAFNEEVAIGI